MRVAQPEGRRGSLKWVQRLVDRRPTLLDQPLREIGALGAEGRLEWLSPLRTDEWAEYRDERFLERIGASHLVQELSKFWPRRGPQWDALARDQSGRIFMFEAKAHAAEVTSSCQAEPASRALICQALDMTKTAFGAPPDADWLNGYYQYANRLAHLHFLLRHGIDAFLVFL